MFTLPLVVWLIESVRFIIQVARAQRQLRCCLTLILHSEDIRAQLLTGPEMLQTNNIGYGESIDGVSKNLSLLMANIRCADFTTEIQRSILFILSLCN